MALHIVVDGYNLIGSENGLRGNLESQRRKLLAQLQRYHQRKDYPITVVFDGWRSGWIYEMEEKVGDLTVIFSRQGEKADDVVQRLARELGDACIVVTSDRELRVAVEASGAAAIYAREFERKLRWTDDIGARPGCGRIPAQKRGNPKKLPKSERKRRQKLGRL
jgi:predicted RNA-binding protein with PIN domain